MESESFIFLVILFIVVATFFIRDAQTIVMCLSVINASMWFYIGNMTLETRKLEYEERKTKSKSSFNPLRRIINAMSGGSNSEPEAVYTNSATSSSISSSSASSASTPCTTCPTAQAFAPQISHMQTRPNNNSTLTQSPHMQTMTDNNSAWSQAPVKSMNLLHTPAFSANRKPDGGASLYDQRVDKLSQWRYQTHIANDRKTKTLRNSDALNKLYEADLNKKEWWDGM